MSEQPPAIDLRGPFGIIERIGGATKAEQDQLVADQWVLWRREMAWGVWLINQVQKVNQSVGDGHDWIDAYGTEWEGSNNAGATWDAIGPVGITNLTQLQVNVALGRLDQKVEIVRSQVDQLTKAHIFLVTLVRPIVKAVARLLDRKGVDPPTILD